jgi:uncharacterized OsmC-like protein
VAQTLQIASRKDAYCNGQSLNSLFYNHLPLAPSLPLNDPNNWRSYMRYWGEKPISIQLFRIGGFMGQMLNGLNVEALGGLVETIKGNPHLSKSIWYASAEWKGGFACEVKSRNFTWEIDEPTDLGGKDTAANPAEMYLGALAGCLNVGYTLNAAMLGVSIDKLNIDLEGDIDLPGFVGLAEAPGFEDQCKLPGYTNVRVKVRMKSDASPEQLDQIHQNVMATSPIGLSVANQVGLDVQMETRRMA